MLLCMASGPSDQPIGAQFSAFSTFRQAEAPVDFRGGDKAGSVTDNKSTGCEGLQVTLPRA